jgi:RNA polymerase sigma factor (sigma-70 family)
MMPATSAANCDPHLLQTMERYHALVRWVCAQHLEHDSDIDDAVQQTWTVLISRWNSIDTERDLSAWLFSTARTSARDLRRAAGRRVLREVAWQEDHASQQERAAEMVALRAEILEYLDFLGDEEKGLLVDYFLMGRNQRELASERGISQPGLKKRLDKALGHLRERLGAAGTVLSTTALLGFFNEARAEITEIAAAVTFDAAAAFEAAQGLLEPQAGSAIEAAEAILPDTTGQAASTGVGASAASSAPLMWFGAPIAIAGLATAVWLGVAEPGPAKPTPVPQTPTPMQQRAPAKTAEEPIAPPTEAPAPPNETEYAPVAPPVDTRSLDELISDARQQAHQAGSGNPHYAGNQRWQRGTQLFDSRQDGQQMTIGGLPAATSATAAVQASFDDTGTVTLPAQPDLRGLRLAGLQNQDAFEVQWSMQVTPARTDADAYVNLLALPVFSESPEFIVEQHLIALFTAPSIPALADHSDPEQWSTITVQALRQPGAWDISYQIDDQPVHRGIYTYPRLGLFLGGAEAKMSFRDITVHALQTAPGWEQIDALQAQRQQRRIKRRVLNDGDRTSDK